MLDARAPYEEGEKSRDSKEFAYSGGTHLSRLVFRRAEGLRKKAFQATAKPSRLLFAPYHKHRALSSVDDFAGYVAHDVCPEGASDWRRPRDNQVIVGSPNLFENLTDHQSVP